MIQSKDDYRFYLRADEIALGVDKSFPRIIIEFMLNDIWAFEKLLRKSEFYINCKNSFFWKPYIAWLRYRCIKKGRKLGFEIPPNVFGPGLGIAHIGTLIVNPNVKVGTNCHIHSLVYIATQATGFAGESKDCPTIGNNVFIGPNTTIVGEIELADDIAIGANSYVATSFTERGITIAVVPARKVSTRGSKGLCGPQDRVASFLARTKGFSNIHKCI